MPRKKVKTHDEIIENWHMDNKAMNSREWKLLFGLAEEDEFNDPYTNVIVTEEPDLLCFQIG